MAKTSMTKSGWCTFGERHDVCYADLTSQGKYDCSCSCHREENG